jgi:hypothetical protein
MDVKHYSQTWRSNIINAPGGLPGPGVSTAPGGSVTPGGRLTVKPLSPVDMLPPTLVLQAGMQAGRQASRQADAQARQGRQEGGQEGTSHPAPPMCGLFVLGTPFGIGTLFHLCMPLLDSGVLQTNTHRLTV